MSQKVLTEAQIAEYTRVAYYYYKEAYTQERIAERMNMSRQRVNRILSECLERGIVQITVKPNVELARLGVESQLKKKFGLLDARVVDCMDAADIYSNLGAEAAKYLATILRDGDIIGVTRGRTLAAMAAQMPVVNRKNVTVAQLMGSRNHEELHTTTNSIAYTIAARLGARQSSMLSPIIVSSSELKRGLQQEVTFREAYQVLQNCTISVAGIGVASRISVLYEQLGLRLEDMMERKEGQVLAGELGGHVFDQAGKPIVNRYWDHIIAVELEDYMRIPVRIGVAGLTEKKQAIYGALRGGYVNVLVTDVQTANLLLEMTD